MFFTRGEMLQEFAAAGEAFHQFDNAATLVLTCTGLVKATLCALTS